MKLPKITQEIEAIQRVNAQLAYQIECFENPENLLALASRPDYNHLKFPYAKEIVMVKEGLAVQGKGEEALLAKNGSRLPIFLGAK